MLLIHRVVVGDQSRVLVTRKGCFDTILGPGVHMLYGRGIETESHSIREPVLVSEWTSFLANERPHLVDTLFHVVETGAAQVALISRDGQLERVQGPGERTLVWKSAARFSVEHIDVVEAPVAPRALVPALGKLGARAAGVSFFAVDEGKCGLLFLDGKYKEAFSPGAYAVWNQAQRPTVETVDLRSQSLEISGQEILTADKVSIRVNLWAEFQIIDPFLSRQAMTNPTEQLYKAVQLAVRQTLAKRTLDEVLNSRTDIDATVAGEVRDWAAKCGMRVGVIAVKDIIPPGEVREILNQVVAAEKKAQANLIARREETAATRNLLNTAKLMAEHPLLVRMKELETLEKVAGKVEKIQILGGVDGLLRNLVSIKD
ncbi:slipin family protein [Bryobacter aggregatus]|uniref:slipin family protein n=1 Tax=Bryobacter aggregatus TaxID=360054 RepID=UPI0004E178CC|nr:slipin family protein [Bryobacter aggregatus]